MRDKIELEELEKNIKAYAKSKGIQIFEGLLGDEQINQIISTNEDYTVFLDYVSNSDNKLIILDIEGFSEDTSPVEGLGLSQIIKDANKLEELEKKYKKYTGSISRIRIAWFKEGFVLVFEKTTDWYDELMEEIEILELEEKGVEKTFICKGCGKQFTRHISGQEPDEEEKEEYCYECIRKVEEKKFKDFARKLSEDEDFVKCRNDAERKIYIEENYSEIIEEPYIFLRQLLERARALINIKKRKKMEG
jgi:hypothetical protein